MIQKIRIQNYKSIADLTLELGQFNVFIGENGCGKTNILEAIAMLSGAKNNRLTIEDLVNQGVRVARPDLTFNAFLSDEQKKRVEYNIEYKGLDNQQKDHTWIECNTNDLHADWETNKWDLNFSDLKDKEGTRDLIRKIQEEGMSKEVMKEALESEDKSFESVLGFLMAGFILYNADRIHLLDYLIYNLNTQALRGETRVSLKQPLGIHGEGLDRLLANFDESQLSQLAEYQYLISWLKDVVLDKEGEYKYKSLNVEGDSILYFKDRFMKENSLFNVENANEGVLHILFYLALFISEKTPDFFAIDNIETALNPKLCRELTKILSTINPKKQALVTTHNPAILDGLDLTNDNIRLFTVRRNGDGHTVCKRIQFKEGMEKEFKLSKMWMDGMLGAIPKNF